MTDAGFDIKPARIDRAGDAVRRKLAQQFAKDLLMKASMSSDFSFRRAGKVRRVYATQMSGGAYVRADRSCG